MKNELASEGQKKKLHAIPEIKLPRGVFNPPPFPPFGNDVLFFVCTFIEFFFLLCICIHSSDSARTAHSCVFFTLSEAIRLPTCGGIKLSGWKISLNWKKFLSEVYVFLIRFHGFIGLQRQRSHEIRQWSSSLVGLFECDFGGFYSVGQLKKKKYCNIHHLRGPVDKATKPLSLIEEKTCWEFPIGEKMIYWEREKKRSEDVIPAFLLNEFIQSLDILSCWDLLLSMKFLSPFGANSMLTVLIYGVMFTVWLLQKQQKIFFYLTILECWSVRFFYIGFNVLIEFLKVSCQTMFWKP